MALSDEKYLSFTTFRKSGKAVASPVWSVAVDGADVAFYSSSGSGKAKRLAHTSKVVLQPSDGRGRVKAGTEPVNGTARVVRGAELEAIQRAIKAKYGFFTKITKLLGTIGGIVKRNRIPYADIGVMVTIDA